MGSKRIGLARMEALMENLKRDLNMVDSTLTNCAITTSEACTFSGLTKTTNTAGLRDARSFRDAGTGGAAQTAISATALSVNTQYKGSTATALAMTIPSAAAGDIGDWITVIYTTAINNGADHTYTTTTDTAFALGSCIRRVGGAVTSAVDLAVAADNVVTITGATNGDGGIGTLIRFVNTTGATNGWAVDALILNSGNGSTAMGSDFS